VYALDFGNQKSYVSGSSSARSLLFESIATATITGSTTLPSFINPVLLFTGSQWIAKTGSFSTLNPNSAFTIQAVLNSQTTGTLFSQTSSVGNFTSQITTTGSGFGFSTTSNYNRQAAGLTPSRLNHITYRYSSGSLDIFHNGTLVTSSQANITLPTSSILDNFYINGLNGIVNNFSGSIANIAVYNRALTLSEIQSNYNLSGIRYGLPSTTLYSLDENAYLFLQSAGITDPIITSSINTFVLGLKSASLWDKMIAIYPFVGTGSVGVNLTGSHKWNLKEPSLVTYPLIFTGSWNGSVSGSTPSGSGTAINTTVSPSTYYPNYSTSSAHISILSYDTPVSSSILAGTGMTKELAVSTLAGDYGTPAAAYSVRKVRTAYSGALMDVRRDYDNTTGSVGYVSNGDLDTGSLLDFVVPGRSTLPGNYSGLAAAYSLRRVSGSYTGSAIDVRRDSDNTTSSIGFNSAGGLDTGTLLAFVTGSANTGSGFVAQWYDQSGNARHATQTATGSQPLIVSSGSLVTDNGKPTLRFDGFNDYLLMNNLQEQSVLDQYFVTNTSDTQYLYPYSSTTANGSKYGFVAFSGSTSTGLTDVYGTPSLYANGTLFTGSNRDNVYSFLTGSKIVVHQGASTLTWPNYTFGFYSTALSYSGSLQELIAYTSSVSSSRTFIENNINTYYSIYTSSAAGYVAKWYDQSGNNRHATQTTAGSQPIIVLSGSVITEPTSSKPVLRFDGLNTKFTLASNISLSAGSSFTSFHVEKKPTSSAVGIWLTNGTSNAPITPVDYSDSNIYLTAKLNASTADYISVNSGVSKYNLLTGLSLNSTLLSNIRKNGIQLTGYTSASENNNNTLTTLGARGVAVSNTDTQEFLLYSSDLTTNTLAIEYGINNYYNIYPQTSSFSTSSFAIYATTSSISASINNDLQSGIASTGPLGFITVSRTGSNSLTLSKNGVTSSFSVPASGALSTNLYLGAINNNGIALGNSPLNISFASVGTGLTNRETKTYTYLVNNLQQNLGRNYLYNYAPNAIAAYSLRKLNPNYAGPALKVRRSSDNTTRDIQFDTNVLDTNALLSFVGTGNGFVETWYDQSGNGNHVNQTSTGSQPTIVVTGSIYSYNNRPGVYFGSPQNLLLGRSIGAITASSTYTVYAMPNTPGQSTVWWTGQTDTWWQQYGTGYTRLFSINRRDGFPSPMITSGQAIFSTYHTGSLMQAFQNGVSMGSNTAAAFTSGSDLILGGQGTSPGPHYGPIHELVIYPTYDTGSRSAIENNLNMYYQVY
jgi:hypothetical protein